MENPNTTAYNMAYRYAAGTGDTTGRQSLAFLGACMVYDHARMHLMEMQRTLITELERDRLGIHRHEYNRLTVYQFAVQYTCLMEKARTQKEAINAMADMLFDEQTTNRFKQDLEKC